MLPSLRATIKDCPYLTYTDHTLTALGKEGIKNVHLICPGFSGENYGYIPCLNDQPSHIDMLCQQIIKRIHSWLPSTTQAERVDERKQRKARALAAGLH
jgi:ferrochelatase